MVVATSTNSSGAAHSRVVEPFNIASYLPKLANLSPDHIAVKITNHKKQSGVTGATQLTYEQLETLSNRYANGFVRVGVARRQRILMMVRPGCDFVAITFALLKIGAIPVIIDPGMGLRRLLECVRQVGVHGLIGIPLAQAIRVLRPGFFRGCVHNTTVGPRLFWGGSSLRTLSQQDHADFAPAATSSNDTAAILFTSGSTGPAKGVVYEHGMFDAQIRMIQSHYGIEPGEVDLPAFPLFALLSITMGMTVVFPDMNPSKPARVDPRKIVQAVHEHQTTNTFGSPALWKRVGDYCKRKRIKLPSLRRVLIAGAPVPLRIIEQMKTALTEGTDVHTPYGATESLPITSISGDEIIKQSSPVKQTQWCATALEQCTTPQVPYCFGTCVGHPLPQIEIRIIKISDEPITHWSNDLLVSDQTTGEIVVEGPVVTKAYLGLPDATVAAKIQYGDTIWHRMGDIGCFDPEGRLWFLGRKAHRVETRDGTLFSVPCETVFNQHPDVFRSALVGMGQRGQQEPVIIVELHDGKLPSPHQARALREQLLQLADTHAHTREIHEILFHRSLPVDIRHNTKINREQLAAWATKKLK